MKYPSFEDLAKVIRDSARLKRDTRIDPDAKVCRDLGLSGKIGINLLKAIESHFNIALKRELFDRIETCESMNQEDRDEVPVIQSLLGRPIPEEDPITVGQLYRVVLQELHARPEDSRADPQAN